MLARLSCAVPEIILVLDWAHGLRPDNGQFVPLNPIKMFQTAIATDMEMSPGFCCNQSKCAVIADLGGAPGMGYDSESAQQDDCLGY